jgi:hypothetical protein
VSAAERERADRATLAEVVDHVVRVESCDADEARRQISKTLANGNLWPLRWEDEQPLPKGSTGGLVMPVDFPPRRWSETEIENIDWEAGTAFDRSEYSPRKGRKRRLLIYRLAIARCWPEKPAGLPGGQVDATSAQLRTGTREDKSVRPSAPLEPKIAAEGVGIAHRVDPLETRTRARRPRRDEKRQEIIQAIAALSRSTKWDESTDKERCGLVEEQLGKPKNWCTLRTLRRAIADAQAAGQHC